MSDEEKFEEEFEKRYQILIGLKEQGLNPNLSSGDKVLANEDGGLEVISVPQVRKDGTPYLSIINGRKETETEWRKRKKKYSSKEAIPVGDWLYRNYSEFTHSMRDRLIDLGYTKGENKLKKRTTHAKKKAVFDDKSTFGKVVTEVSKGALDNKDTDVKAGDKK